MSEFTDRMQEAKRQKAVGEDLRARQVARVHQHMPGTEVTVNLTEMRIEISRGPHQYDDWGVSFDQLQALSEEFGTKDINLMNSERAGGGSWTGPGTSSTWIEIHVKDWSPR